MARYERCSCSSVYPTKDCSEKLSGRGRLSVRVKFEAAGQRGISAHDAQRKTSTTRAGPGQRHGTTACAGVAGDSRCQLNASKIYLCFPVSERILGVALFQHDLSTLTCTVFYTITLTTFTPTNSLHFIMPGFHYSNPLAYAGSIPGFSVRQQYVWQGTEIANAGTQPQPEASAPAPSQRQIAPLPAPKQRKSRTTKDVGPAPQAGSSTSNPSQIHTVPIAVPNTQQNTMNVAGPSKKRVSGTKAKAPKRKAVEVEPASPTLARPEKKGKVAHASTASWPAPHTIVPFMGPPLQPASPPQAALLPGAAPAHRAALPQAVPPSASPQTFHPSSVRYSLPQGNQPPYSAFYPPGNALASGPQSRPAPPSVVARRVTASRDASAQATGSPITPVGTPVALQCFPPLPLAQAANNVFPCDASVTPYGVPQGTPAARAGPSFPVGMWRELLLNALSNMTDAVHRRYWTLLAGHIMTQMARLPEDHPEKPDFNALVQSCSQPFPVVAQTNVAGPSQPRQYVPQQQAGPAMDPRTGYPSAYGAGPAHPIGREGQLEEMDRVYPINGAGQGGASEPGPYGDPRLGTAEHPIVLDDSEEYSIEDLYADA